MLLACLILPLAFAGCGESEQEKAEKSVCSAKAQIASSVQSLQSLTIANVSASKIQSDINSISEGLKTMQQAQSKLRGTRKEAVTKANAALATELTDLAHELAGLTLTEATTKLTAAFDKLAASYKRAVAPIEC